MAFTKITLTGAVDTLKVGFTAFNTLIDDLLAVTSGKGASQIGIYDSADNMAAANVEDALAEIYTDVATARTLADTLDENPATTTGLTWGYKDGQIRIDNSVVSVTASTIALTDDATNYVEVNTSGTVTKNTSAFTSGYIPVREIVCASGVQTDSTDKRSWFNTMPIASTAEVLLGQNTQKIVTPASLRNNLYYLMPQRAKFTYKDTDEIYIEPAVYQHNGTVDQLVYWNSQLTYTFLNLGTSDWSYLYIDDSAVVTADTNILTVSELIDSVTEPSWSAAKRGWYNGEDRCIFAVLTDGADHILQFFNNGEFVSFDSEIENRAAAALSDTPTDVTLSIPKFCTQAQVVFRSAYSDVSSFGLWRTNGASGSHTTTAITATADGSTVIDRVSTDSGQIIEVSHNAAGTNTMAVSVGGWYFPAYM